MSGGRARPSAPAWTCDGCSQPITTSGYLWVKYHDIGRATAAVSAWESAQMSIGADGFPEPVDVGQAADVPDPARWYVHHRACDPEADVACYWVEVERLDTWSRVVGWTVHLMGKSWLDVTDWRDLLRRAGADCDS